MISDSNPPDFDALWNFNDPAGTEARFRELVPAAVQSGDRGRHAELMTQIARTLGLQRKFPDAHNELDRVQDLLPKSTDRPRIRYLLERGRVFNSSGEPAEARPLFEEAWALAREKGEDNLAVDAAHMIAIVADPDEQIEWNERAMSLAESSEDPKARKWLASLYNNLGWTYHDRGHFERALDLFEKALALRKERGELEPYRIAQWSVARALRSLGRVDEALAIQRALKSSYDQTGASDGFVEEELGECLLADGRSDEAKPHFAEAYRLLSADPWLAEKEPERLERLRELSQ